MPSYIISVPKSDTCLDVSYDPRTQSVYDVCHGGIPIDPDGFYVSVPVGRLDFKIVNLREYLADEAAAMYANDDEAKDQEHAGALEYASDFRSGR